MKPAESVLVATDFSEEAGFAAKRGASLAREMGLRGALAHVLPASLPAGLHVQAATRAQEALAVLAEETAREGPRFELRLLSGKVDEALAEAAQDFDLVVAGARGQRLLAGFSLGRVSAHLARLSRRPVLIVKRPPEGPYRRVVAAVDFSEPAREAVQWAARLAPQAEVHLVHAFEVEFESTLRFTGVADDEVHAYRRQARERAVRAIERLIGQPGVPRERIARTVAHGYPPRVILDCAAQTDAQLVAVGKHAAGRIERLLIGSVALQVLEQAECDVLVVPGD